MSISHDTVFTGTGNDYFNPQISQFDPSLGDLTAVVVKSKVSLKYGFTIENVLSSSQTPIINVVRNDYILNDALPNGYAFNSLQRNYGPYSLAASNGVSNAGPDFALQAPTSFMNNTIVANDSIIAGVAPFLGNSIMSYDYYPSTYSIVPSGLTYTFNAIDTVHFSVKYYYCSATVLATNILDFTATLSQNTIVQLAWTATNETKGGTYFIEKSTDGSHFIDISSMPTTPEDGDTHYSYPYGVGTQSGTLYFRLKIVGSEGNIKYSEIRVVDLGGGTSGGVYLYPNPSSQYINVVFNQSGSNWEMDIMGVNGNLVQRSYSLNTTTAHIDFQQPLAAGVYFMRVTNQQTRQYRIASFVVK